MADQDARASFWTSLPGILTGIAAIIGAVVSGLAIWHNSQPAPQNNNQKKVVEPAGRTDGKRNAGENAAEGKGGQTGGPGNENVPKQSDVAKTASAATAVVGSRDWCAEKYKAWADLKAQTGADDSGLRHELTAQHCAQYNFILGKPKPAQ